MVAIRLYWRGSLPLGQSLWAEGRARHGLAPSNVIKLGGALAVAFALRCRARSSRPSPGRSRCTGSVRRRSRSPRRAQGDRDDPFVTGNPKTPADQKDLAKLGKVDLILVTHGHGRSRRDGGPQRRRERPRGPLQAQPAPRVFGPAGLIQTLIDLGWLTAEQAVRFGKSGKVQPLGPQITITPGARRALVRADGADPATKKFGDLPGR